MVATPSYVFERKILKQFAHNNQSLENALNEFEKILLKNKIEYILINQPSKIHRSENLKPI